MGRTDDEATGVSQDAPFILVARELSPGLTVQLDREQLLGLVSEEGTRTSHAAILAHSLGIPAVMGASGAVNRITRGTMVLIDGQTGSILLDPTREELELARVRATRRQKIELELEGLKGQPALTPDGHQVALLGNVDLPEEIDLAVRHGAEGVGLLRTEFLVTGRARLPTEDEQYRILPARLRGVSRSDGGDPHLRSRRRQVPGGVRRAAGGQSVPRAGARSGSVSTGPRSSGPSSGPCSGWRPTATSGSCCR